MHFQKLIFSLLLFCFFPLLGDNLFQSETYFENIQVTELVLKNGLHVYLHPSEDDEEQEIILQLAAPGGYSSFPSEDQASARLIAEIVWESGFGSLSSDQLSALLYNYSIELDFAVKPFYRTIGGECGRESLPMLIKLIGDFLARPQFQKSGLETTKKVIAEVIDQSELDKTQQFENAFFLLNTKLQPKNIPLTKKELETIHFEKVPAIFEQLFGNPQNFCCVITGDFDITLIKTYIAKFFGELPNKANNLPVSIPAPPQFPSQPVSQVTRLKNGMDSFTRITFPIITPIDATNIYKLEMVCQTMEVHLRNIMKRRLKSSNAVAVAYEFPFYPTFMSPWITIQFRSDFDQADDLAKIIVSEVQHLKRRGPSLIDLKTAVQNQKANDEFWHQDDDYWLSFLTNAFLMGLDASQIFDAQAKEKLTSLDKMKETFSQLFDANRYTQLTTKPE